MKLDKFKAVSSQDLENLYGGWAWLATAIPIGIQVVSSIIGLIKGWNSTTGSIKTPSGEVKWDNKQGKDSNLTFSKVVYYAY